MESMPRSDILLYPFQLRGKWPTWVILENHGCSFTRAWETAIKPTCVCVYASNLCYLLQRVV
jgi:hypothetical protein